MLQRWTPTLSDPPMTATRKGRVGILCTKSKEGPKSDYYLQDSDYIMVISSLYMPMTNNKTMTTRRGEDGGDNCEIMTTTSNKGGWGGSIRRYLVKV